MADKPWKVHERAVAKRLGGKRAGPTGREGPDVLVSLFAVECKERQRPLPKALTNALDQSASAARPGQLPLVVWHVVNQRHDQDVVMLRLRDFEAWAGTLAIGAGEPTREA